MWRGSLREKLPRKTLLIMRFSVVLLFGILFQVSAGSLAQKVVIQKRQMTYKALFKEIEKQTGLITIYNNSQVDMQQMVELSAAELELNDLYREILDDKGLTFEVVDDYVVIRPKPMIVAPIELSSDYQENKKVLKGSVVDGETNLFLVGVNVYIKGTTLGTITDENGQFEFTAPDEQGVIIFSFIGYEDQDIAIEGKTTFSVVLVPVVSSVDEVIVYSTGYSKISKERSTGSFIQVDAKKLAKRSSTSLTSKLRGLTPGMMINDDGSIEIRGRSTMNANEKPLIVVDGFPISQSDFSSINPEDVEKVNVLKDAAAASIWGARSSNGVIVITTKSGKYKQETTVDVNANLFITEKIDLEARNLLNTSDYLDLQLELIDKGWTKTNTKLINGSSLSLVELAWVSKNRNLPNGQNLTDTQYTDYISDLKNQNAYEQYEKYLFRNSFTQSYNVSLNSGGETNKVFTSVSFYENKAGNVGNRNDRVTMNVQDHFKLNDKIEISFGLNGVITNRENNGWNGSVNSVKPYENLVNGDNERIQYYTRYNPIYFAQREAQGIPAYTRNQLDVIDNNDNTTKGLQVRSWVSANIEIVKGLKFNSKFYYDKIHSKSLGLLTMDHPDQRNLVYNFATVENSGNFNYLLPYGSKYSTSERDSYSWDTRNILTYDINQDKHQLNILGGSEIRKSYTEGFSDSYLGYDAQTTTHVPINRVDWAAGQNNWDGVNQSVKLKWSYFNDDLREVSFFGNMAYTYNHKYTLTGSYRVDQKNLYGSDPDFRYKPLWSIGLGWRMKQEQFLNNIEWIDRLNLRATYGVTGNASNKFSPYAMAVPGMRVTIMDQNIIEYMNLVSPANPMLKWEETKTLNLALEYAVLNNRLSGSFEYYNKQSDDLVHIKQLDPTSGWTSAHMNYAELSNKGIDISLNAHIIRRPDIKWNVGINFSYNNNEIIKVEDDQDSPWNLLPEQGKYLKEGNAYTDFYVYNYGGLNESGEVIMIDADGEEHLWEDYDAETEDMIKVGPRVAPFYGGIFTNFEYKNFDFSLNTVYKFGHYFHYSPSYVASAENYNIDAVWSDRWQESGDEKYTVVPKLSDNKSDHDNIDKYFINSMYNVHKADYFKISDIVIGYTLKKHIEKIGIKNLRVSMQVTNPYTWVKNDLELYPESPQRTGMTNLKSIIFGVKATF